MKKSIKLFLITAVTLTFVFSLISTKVLKANQVQLCQIGPYIESISYSGVWCTCHGESQFSSTCQTHYGCHLTCYVYVCE